MHRFPGRLAAVVLGGLLLAPAPLRVEPSAKRADTGPEAASRRSDHRLRPDGSRPDLIPPTAAADAQHSGDTWGPAGAAGGSGASGATERRHDDGRAPSSGAEGSAAGGSSGSDSIPTPTVTGPIRPVEGSYPWFATDVDLASVGYVEEEFFVEGMARTYAGSEVNGASPYKTRVLVRRPASAKAFSGVVVVEWLNVSYGYDVDFDWLNSHEFFIRSGWAWVGVSAQAAGVNHLRLWNPTRYESLHVAADPPPAAGEVGGELLGPEVVSQLSTEQSADIFAQAGKALFSRLGADPMGGLRPKALIADGHSQSAAKLGSYYNNQQANDRLFAGFFLRGFQLSPLRDDLPYKVLRLLSETEVWYQRKPPVAGPPVEDAPDSDNFRRWEVAGTSHVTWKEYRQVTSLLAREGLAWDPGICAKPPYSQVPFHHAQNAAYDHLWRWIRGRGAPPVSPPIEADGTATLPRDEAGFAVGGIRLADLDVPTSLQTGENHGGLLCILYGSREPFSHDELMRRYPDRMTYVRSVDAAVRRSLQQGFMLPEDARHVCLAARRAQLGWSQAQPSMSDDHCRHPGR